MDPALRTFVAQRAGHRCEYCHLPEQFVPSAFHVEHIIPKQHRGSDSPDNCCYACNQCNWSKGPNLTGIDGCTGQIVPLFDPRQQSWDDHFAWQGAPHCRADAGWGRVTVDVLQMNAPRRVRLRGRLAAYL